MGQLRSKIKQKYRSQSFGCGMGEGWQPSFCQRGRFSGHCLSLAACGTLRVSAIVIGAEVLKGIVHCF